jgi:hypothetical protein
MKLLARPKYEVTFNFMFEFINRAASINDPITVKGLDELMPYGEWKLRASGAHREVGPERSVEQSRGPMDKNRITRPTRPDERASDREVQGHQGPGW